MQTVLVVEDEELISTMIRINIEQEGMAVQSFGDAEALLAYLAAPGAACDLILLDIMLPQMSGEEALLALREMKVSAPVMMLTAKSDVDSRVNALNQGADDYLAKPFNVRELLARVHALLRRPAAGPAADKE